MSWYPYNDVVVPLPWFGYPAGEKGGNNILAVVHHIAEGGWSTLINRDFWASRNGGSGGSVHFAVSKSGQVAQFVDIADSAYGNGIVANPTWKYATPGNPNEKTVSIEHEGFTGEPWPEAQYQASKKLTDWILGRALMPANTDTIIGHYRIDSVNRAQCPGSGWPIARLLAELNGTEEDELDAADRAALDWLKANRSALSPLALAARRAGFDGEHDTEAKDDDVSRGIRRFADFETQVLMAPLTDNPQDTADRLARALSRD